MATAPDVISRPQIPLEATSDAPVIDAPKPPESASNDPTDQESGTPKEITAEELAVAASQREGKLETATEGNETDPAAKKPPAEGEEPPKLEFDELDPKLPGYAVREITKHRKDAQAKADAAWKAARAQTGDEAWDKAVAITRDAQVEAARKEAKVAKDAATALEKQIEELKAKVPVVEEPEVEDPRPARDEYDDPDLYDDALMEWGKREGVRAAEAAEVQKRESEAAAERQRLADETQAEHEAEVNRVHTAWQDKRTTAIEKYPDYVEVAEAAPEDGGPVITEAMAAAILQSDNGTEVAYWLGQNTDEATRIASIKNVALQIMEMGRLVERLANPSRRAAPRHVPIEPVDTTRTTPEETEEPDMDTYYKRRNEALRANSRPFFPPSGIH